MHGQACLSLIQSKFNLHWISSGHCLYICMMDIFQKNSSIPLKWMAELCFCDNSKQNYRFSKIMNFFTGNFNGNAHFDEPRVSFHFFSFKLFNRCIRKSHAVHIKFFSFNMVQYWSRGLRRAVAFFTQKFIDHQLTFSNKMQDKIKLCRCNKRLFLIIFRWNV